MKINIETSPLEIWIGIRFHNGSGSPLMIKTVKDEIIYSLQTDFYLIGRKNALFTNS